jgi:membrane fusion protein
LLVKTGKIARILAWRSAIESWFDPSGPRADHRAQGETVSKASEGTLFRKQSASAARHRLFGDVCLSTPPTTAVTLLFALISVALLGAVVYAVEVPQRTRAIGVLMPAGGLLQVIATDVGRVADLAVKEGMTVSEGQLLLRMTNDRHAPGRSPVSEAQIHSLKTELGLIDRVHDQEQEIKSSRVAAFRQQIALARSRLAKAEVELGLQVRHVRLMEQRLDRMTVLAANGSIADDTVAQQRSGLLQTKAHGTGLEREMLQIRQELWDLQIKHDQAAEAAELDRLHHGVNRERLLRQIGDAEIEAGRIVLAPTAGIVARLAVKIGSTTRPGQTLMTLYRAEGKLEAWLYLPSDQAGQLQGGQEVEIRLDPYPHQVFGTLTAIVSEVSNIALLASDLSVPLPIEGPVFEVRALLSDESIHGYGATWPLAPGTSFRADLIRQRYRLYQWLLRSILHSPRHEPAVVGA